mmetsp:Transcript_7009/g.15847  ORF Transcript_7009/g.15847 Transcript_7009/m.15847 type:complete len:235 (+) Transcript_7009:795-1499(+)
MRYLKFLLYPLSAVWGLYNLYHYSYKSWWSWLVSSLADFAYTFGFINMMPQIFINYKLKSVAHMPWRVLMYKFFNTFIDDVFAFCIMSDYMTKKHRFMTLRDDIVFFVFLYQRYIYKVDPKRPDEFGYVYNDELGVPPKAELEGEASEGATATAEQSGKDGQQEPSSERDPQQGQAGEEGKAAGQNAVHEDKVQEAQETKVVNGEDATKAGKPAAADPAGEGCKQRRAGEKQVD